VLAHRQEAYTFPAHHQKSHGVKGNARTAAAAKGMALFAPFGIGRCELAAASCKSKAHPADWNNHCPVGGFHRVSENRINVHHGFQTLHGGLHKSFNGVSVGHNSAPFALSSCLASEGCSFQLADNNLTKSKREYAVQIKPQAH